MSHAPPRKNLDQGVSITTVLLLLLLALRRTPERKNYTTAAAVKARKNYGFHAASY